MGDFVRRAFWFLVWAVLRAWAVFCPYDERCAPPPGGAPGQGGGPLYYRRWNVWPGYLLTCFHTSDPDRGWHDHPWLWMKSRILRGAYYQDLRGAMGFDPGQVYIAGDVNRLTDEFHKIRKLSDGLVWTLLHHGQYHGVVNAAGTRWGFIDRVGNYTPAEKDSGECPGGVRS